MKNFLLLCIILIIYGLQAQKVQDTVKTEVINVTRSFEPKVQDAYKLDVNPEIEKLTEEKIPVEFHIQSIPVASTFTPEKGAMTNFNTKNIIENVYKSYVALSGGNYLQTQGDAYIFYPVNDNLGSAFRLSHYSSQGKKENDTVFYNPFYHTSADLLFDYKDNANNKWNFNLGYNGHAHTYNKLYPNGSSFLDYNTLKNNTNNFLLGIHGAVKEFYLENLDFTYNNFFDSFNNSEYNLHFLGNFKFPVSKLDLKLGLQADLVRGDMGKINFLKNDLNLNIDYKNVDLGILPAIQIENNKLVLNVGAKIFYQNQDTLYKQLQFIPDIKASFNAIYEKMTLFIGLTGDLKQNTQANLSAVNPYLSSSNYILPSLVPYDIFGGFSGAFSSAFSYEVKLGARKVKNYPFYNAEGIYVAKYVLFYDDMNQSYFNTSLNIGIGKKFDLKLYLTYMQSDPDNLKKPLFIPDFSFKTILLFKPIEKLSFSTTLHSTGNTNYKKGIDDYIAGYNDLNLGIRYNINEQFTAFLQANNILAKPYEIYAFYPVQQLQIMTGAVYRFDIYQVK